MIYLVGWFSVYVALFFERVGGFKYLLPSFLICIPILFIAFFRGDVGIDTTTYDHMTFKIINGDVNGVFEPGFELYVKIMAFLGIDGLLIVRFVAAIIFISLFFIAKKGGHNTSYYILSFFIPIFYFDFSMNAMRLGVAVCLFFISVLYYKDSKIFASLIFALFSVSFHSSAILIFSIFILYNLRFSVKHLTLFFVFLISSGFVFFLGQQYFIYKLEAYNEFQSPSSLSGLRHFVYISILNLALYFSNLGSKNKIKFFILTTFLFFSFFLVSRYSYAGLRLLEILTLVYSFVIVYEIDKNNLSISSISKVFYLVGGLFGVIVIYKGYLYNYATSSSFLPYSTFLN
jgi:hypothetical protein